MIVVKDNALSPTFSILLIAVTLREDILFSRVSIHRKLQSGRRHATLWNLFEEVTDALPSPETPNMKGMRHERWNIETDVCYVCEIPRFIHYPYTYL